MSIAGSDLKLKKSELNDILNIYLYRIIEVVGRTKLILFLKTHTLYQLLALLFLDELVIDCTLPFKK